MADKVNYTGRLIAIDGTRGKDVAVAANAVAGELKHRGIECGVSRWDASGLFSELAASGRGSRSVSARALAQASAHLSAHASAHVLAQSAHLSAPASSTSVRRSSAWRTDEA